MSLNGTLKEIEISKLIIPRAKIRPKQADHQQYENMKQSIALHGVQQPVLVSNFKNEQGQNVDGVYTLIDGLQRKSICDDLGIKTIPALVLPTIDEDDMYLLQDTLNVHRVPQKPKERLEHLKRLSARHPEWTIDDLAQLTCERKQNLERFMKLVNLTSEALELTDKGKIKITAAISLSELPQDKQNEHLEEAMILPADEWVTKAAALRKAYKQGKPTEDLVVMNPLKLGELRLKLSQAERDFAAQTPGSAEFNYYSGRLNMIKEVLQIDDETIAAKKADKERRKLESEERRAAKKEEEARKAREEVLGKKAAMQPQLAESLA